MTVTHAMCGDQSSVFSPIDDSRHYRSGGQFCETPESLNLVKRDSLKDTGAMSAKSLSRRKDVGLSDCSERVMNTSKLTDDEDGAVVNASSDEDLPGAGHANSRQKGGSHVPALTARTNAKGEHKNV